MANLYYVKLYVYWGEIRGQLVKGATTTTNTGYREVIKKTFILLNHSLIWRRF
jgi:hypothetical protein